MDCGEGQELPTLYVPRANSPLPSGILMAQATLSAQNGLTLQDTTFVSKRSTEQGQNYYSSNYSGLSKKKNYSGPQQRKLPQIQTSELQVLQEYDFHKKENK